MNSIYLHPNCSKWDSTNEFYLRSYIATDWTKNGSNINISWVWLIWIYSFCFCPHIWNRESDLRIAVCMWNVGLWKYQTLWCSSWRLYCCCSHWSESVYSPNLYWGQAGARTDGTSVQFLSEQVYWCIEHLYSRITVTSKVWAPKVSILPTSKKRTSFCDFFCYGQKWAS